MVDASWLDRHGYGTSLRSKYVAAGWLEKPASRVFRRPGGRLEWQQVVISLQTILDHPLIVGGRTALELQGFSHYLSRAIREVHLYGLKAPPTWLDKLKLEARFKYHNIGRLFRNDPITRGIGALKWNVESSSSDSITPISWGTSEWPLTLSTPERAILELLDELPKNESFHEADMLMEGLSNLRPRRLQRLLTDCKSVKVKRLFFFFAERHHHTWLKQLDRTPIDLGKGKRLIQPGGKLDKAFQITVPEDLIGIS